MNIRILILLLFSIFLQSSQIKSMQKLDFSNPLIKRLEKFIDELPTSYNHEKFRFFKENCRQCSSNALCPEHFFLAENYIKAAKEFNIATEKLCKYICITGATGVALWALYKYINGALNGLKPVV